MWVYKTLRALTLLFVIGGVGGGLLLGGLWLWAQRGSPLEVEDTFEVRETASLHELSHVLFKKKVVPHPYFWWAYVKVFGDFRQVRSGTYPLSPGISPHEVLEKMILGESIRELMLSLTIPEGFNLSQVMARLEGLGLGSLAEIQKVMGDVSLREEFSIKAPHLEGYLYPETYQFYDQKPSLRMVIRTMIQQFFKELPQDYKQLLQVHDLTLGEWVIFASLIEKETAQMDEKSKVSEVIWNRLKKGMPLGIDATLIYGIPGFDGDLTFRHLADKTNPYNSRIHKGLPPTAIAMVSRSSLQAVFTPTEEGYLYYVLMPGEEKRHYFSDNMRSHNEAVKRLVRSFRRKKN